MNRGKALELFYITGKPDEMVTATLSGWTGQILKFPRSQIKEAIQRKEAEFTGVYLLLGEVDGKRHAYLGKSKSLSERMKQHSAMKPWWNQAVLITTKSDELDSTRVDYLESRLLQKSKAAAQYSLENTQFPPLPKTSEALLQDMEAFIRSLEMVLPPLRIDLFVETDKPATKHETNAKVTFKLVNGKNPKISATAVLEADKFVVLKGSQARATWSTKESKPSTYKPLHALLLEQGTLSIVGDIAVFTEDYPFDNPSAAGAVCNGTATQGPSRWKNEATGSSFAEWAENTKKGALS